jgi:hypothetical protein
MHGLQASSISHFVSPGMAPTYPKSQPVASGTTLRAPIRGIIERHLSFLNQALSAH